MRGTRAAALIVALLGAFTLVQPATAAPFSRRTGSGPGTMTPHHAMVNSRGFGQTIRSINGSLECDGRNPGQVESRVSKYRQFTGIIGVATGGNLYC